MNLGGLLRRESKTVKNKSRSGDPLPRPQNERLDLPEDQHLDFWRLVIREFDWQVSRVQSKILYHNRAMTPHEGEAPK